MSVDPPQSVGHGAELERAPKPPDLQDVMRVQVDRAFADVLGGDHRNPLTCGGDAGAQDVA